ncbi:D-2-hydroxyacid dehydrogenase [Burkholderiaceae bacterium DAT-1]|nr:D-2-hydroxyacid dehydrogenase [Burkholderiaceae bacterium DAT-1]
MTRIVFLDRASLPVDLRSPSFPHAWQAIATTSPEQILAHAHGAQVLISNKVPLRADVIRQLPDLKLIAVAATGVNQIDVAAANAAGIQVCNIRGYARTTVPEHALMLMLALSRRLPAYQHDVAAGRWQRSPNFCLFGDDIRDLAGQTVAIIGHGDLGQATAHLCRAFGMRVLLAEHRGASVVRDGYTTFESCVAEADIISLHCPLTEATRNLFDASTLAAMKPGAILINTARGGLVDENALLTAVLSGHLGGAGVDVLAQEPPPAHTPLLSVQHPNLIVTPHIGWASLQAMQALGEQLIGNIECWAAGTPRNLCA